jgi:hypothetical protein
MTKAQVQAQVRDLFDRWERKVPVRNASEQKWRDIMAKENQKLVKKYL